MWTAQILLAAIFSFAAVAKLAGAHTSVQMFNQMGAGQWLRYFVGTAELAGAIGLLVPRLAGRAAAGLAADMAGASIVNIAVLHSGAVALTVPLCVVCALVARSRWGAGQTYRLFRGPTERADDHVDNRSPVQPWCARG